MRDILFRGKRIDNGEWVEGSLITEIEYDGYDGDKRNVTSTKCFIKKQGAVVMEDTSGNGMITINAYKVDPNTVSQYIGLKDLETEHKVFGGDFVKMHQFLFNGVEYEHEVIGLVEYEEEVACYGLTNLNDLRFALKSGFSSIEESKDLFHPICLFYGLHEYSFEVIGNKWDNPELLL